MDDRLQLREELPSLEARSREVERVRIRKRIVTELRTIEVPVLREELVYERVQIGKRLTREALPVTVTLQREELRTQIQ